MTNQAVCQEQLGMTKCGIWERQPSSLAVVDMDIFAINTGKVTTNVLAAIHWLAQLDLGFMPDPVGEIGQTRQWSINARRADLQTICLHNWIKLVKQIGNAMRQCRAIIDVQLPCLGTLGHHLQGRLVTALRAIGKPRHTHQ